MLIFVFEFFSIAIGRLNWKCLRTSFLSEMKNNNFYDFIFVSWIRLEIIFGDHFSSRTEFLMSFLFSSQTLENVSIATVDFIYFFDYFNFLFLFQILWLVAVKLSHLSQCCVFERFLFKTRKESYILWRWIVVVISGNLNCFSFFLLIMANIHIYYIIFIIAKCHAYFSVFALLRYKSFLIRFVRSFFQFFFCLRYLAVVLFLYKLLKSTISDFSINYACIALGADDQWLDP